MKFALGKDLRLPLQSIVTRIIKFDDRISFPLYGHKEDRVSELIFHLMIFRSTHGQSLMIVERRMTVSWDLDYVNGHKFSLALSTRIVHGYLSFGAVVVSDR